MKPGVLQRMLASSAVQAYVGYRKGLHLYCKARRTLGCLTQLREVQAVEIKKPISAQNASLIDVN